MSTGSIYNHDSKWALSTACDANWCKFRHLHLSLIVHLVSEVLWHLITIQITKSYYPWLGCSMLVLHTEGGQSHVFNFQRSLLCCEYNKTVSDEYCPSYGWSNLLNLNLTTTWDYFPGILHWQKTITNRDKPRPVLISSLRPCKASYFEGSCYSEINHISMQPTSCAAGSSSNYVRYFWW